MSLEGAYDPGNVFARILRGEIPAARIFETDEVLAFMDAFPQSRGHALVVSKISEARNIFDMAPETFTAVMREAQVLARALRAALKPDGLLLTQFNGSAAGQTVFHLHVHLIPRWEGRPMAGHGRAGAADREELEALARSIAAEVRR